MPCKHCAAWMLDVLRDGYETPLRDMTRAGTRDDVRLFIESLTLPQPAHGGWYCPHEGTPRPATLDDGEDCITCCVCGEEIGIDDNLVEGEVSEDYYVSVSVYTCEKHYVVAK